MIRSRVAVSVVAIVTVLSVVAFTGSAFAGQGWSTQATKAGPAPGEVPVAFRSTPSGPGTLGSGIDVLSPAYVLKWGTYGTGNTQFIRPGHVAVDQYGYVYVTDLGNNRVKKYTSTGSWIRSWGATGSANGQFSGPHGIAADRYGYVWVSDLFNGRIQKFTSSGVFVGSYGSGTLTWPHGIAVDDMGYVYVADESADRIYRFTQSGVGAGSIGGLGSGDGQLNTPLGLALGLDNKLYVADFGNDRVQVYGTGGEFNRKWGVAGSAAGQMQNPTGISVDPLGRVWVSDEGNNRVQVFSSTGAYMAQFGTLGSGNSQFDALWGTAVDGSGFFTTELANYRVKKYSLGEAKPVERVGGADRYQVAVNLALERFPGYAGVRHVIVVCGEDRASADPLGAAQLAGVYDAPVLLTQSATLNSRTKSALTAMRASSGPLEIHVIGGTVSVPTAVYNQIAATNAGGTIERITGADRYALSVAMAKRVRSLIGNPAIPGVILFNGESPAAFFDALAASPMAARSQLVMMAVKKDSIPSSVGSALAVEFAGEPRFVANSATYVSAANYTALGASSRMTSKVDRYDAACDIAHWGRGRGYIGFKHVGLANKLPDALTGGSFAGAMDGAMLYTGATTLDTTTGGDCVSHRNNIFKGWMFGGTASVSDSVKGTFTTKIQ